VEALVDAEKAHVDPFARQEVANEVSVRVATDSRDDRGRQAKAGETGRDIAGEAPDEARVRADLAQRCPELVRVEVDSHTAEDGDVDHARDLRTART
jgi:hypothetical protein